MIYNTLKSNKEHGIRNIDIFTYYEECYGCTGELFGEEYCTQDNWGDNETNDDKLFADFTERQIASAILKQFKAMAKDKDDPLMLWNKVFWETALPEICYEQTVELIKAGEITKAKQLKELDRKARKNGCTIKKDIEENGYYHYNYITDLIDEYFPCHDEMTGEGCNNCGNCQ